MYKKVERTKVKFQTCVAVLKMKEEQHIASISGDKLTSKIMNRLNNHPFKLLVKFFTVEPVSATLQ